MNYKTPLPAKEDVVVTVRVEKSEPSKSGKSQKVYLRATMASAKDATIIYSEATSLYISKNSSPLSAAVQKVLTSIALG